MYHTDTSNLKALDPEGLVYPLAAGPEDQEVSEDHTSFKVLGGPSEALKEKPCIAYESPLLSLAPAEKWRTCKEKGSITVQHVGSAVTFVWVTICYIFISVFSVYFACIYMTINRTFCACRNAALTMW